MNPDIFSYIKSEENRFETEEIQVGDNWSWSFRDHVQLIFHLKNGVFSQGENKWLRAFKNIMDPILNLAYWMEDIELKDVTFYIENQTERVLSFLLKKYHDEVYVKENNLDTMLDEIAESDIDYGGTLLQKTDTVKPEVLALNTIAFCDQSDLLGGVTGFKFNFSPSKLRAMAKLGWGDEKNGATTSIEDLIVLADDSKASGKVGTKENKTTGKNIEVYIVRGNLPEGYLKDNHDMETYVYQIQIVAFYTDAKGKKQGVCLYKKEGDEGDLKFHTSKKVFGRALGRGTGEALLHPQIWTNLTTIHKQNLLKAASKVPLFTDDAAYSNRNKIKDMENLEITVIKDDSKIGIRQVPTATPANIQLYTESIDEWYAHAQLEGSAFDPQLGKQQASGTTFRGQNQLVQQGRGLHDRRRGQRAKFIEEIYRDWIIPDMVKGILKGKKFLATLSADEMQWVVEQLADNFAEQQNVDLVLNGEFPPNGMTFMAFKDENKKKYMTDFRKKGNKLPLEILKDEFRDVEVKIGINVAGKQKDLAGMSDKVLSIIQFAFQNPAQFTQTLQIPGMTKAFNDILEFGGMSPVDFSGISSMPIPSPLQPNQMNPQQAQPVNQPQ